MIFALTFFFVCIAAFGLLAIMDEWLHCTVFAASAFVFAVALYAAWGISFGGTP